MDSRALHIFRIVAETGSLSAAARELNTVQSNVTAHLKRLEQGLGTPLFYRRPRGVEPTPAGEVLLGYARRVAHLLGEAAKAVQEAGAGGRLRLGTLETLAAARLPRALARFRRAFPQVELKLVTGSTEVLATEVLAFRLDGAFVAGTLDHADIEQQVVRVEELVLVSESGSGPLAGLRDQTLILFRPGCAFRARAELWLRDQGLLPTRFLELGALDAILGCVAAGMGVTLLPRVAVDRPHYRDELCWHPIPEPYARLPMSFIRHREAMEPRALAELVRLARD